MDVSAQDAGGTGGGQVPVGGGDGGAQDMESEDLFDDSQPMSTDEDEGSSFPGLSQGSKVKICQKSRRMGCVIPHCKLQYGITLPIIKLFDISTHAILEICHSSVNLHLPPSLPHVSCLSRVVPHSFRA